MISFISDELSSKFIIFKDEISGQYCVVENSKWDTEYRYNEKRFCGNEPFKVEVELLKLDNTKNEYIRTGCVKSIEHFDLKAVLIEKQPIWQ